MRLQPQKGFPPKNRKDASKTTANKATARKTQPKKATAPQSPPKKRSATSKYPHPKTGTDIFFALFLPYFTLLLALILFGNRLESARGKRRRPRLGIRVQRV